MDDIRVAPLRAWSVATFHTVGFVVSAVAFAHASDSLKEAMARLDTKIGVAFFVAFWALTYFVTCAGLRKMTPIETASTSSIVFRTTIAGGWNGVGVYAILVTVGLGSGFTTQGLDAMRFLPVQFLVTVIGSLLAFTVGAVVGLVYGLVDALVFGCAEMLYRASNASASV